ncbi:hypothetical protein ACS0TY_003310 [Phlomoides rotata]
METKQISITTTLSSFLLLFSSFLANASSEFNRSNFPPGFLFGVGSAAYQYEGAAFEDGKGPSTWDNFTHQFPEKIADRSNGDVATDFYHRYKDDVKLLKYLGVDIFRMSISWSRILPDGKLSGGVNSDGIAFYNNVFNELLANGIIPFVTLFHWDVPQALEDEYRSFLSPLIIDDYKDFADLCFHEFGDRIKHWITLNEPYTFTNYGYNEGILAPGRCSNRSICSQGNSSTEPYIVAHNLLLSHAAAVKLYKEKYQVAQNGEIGITLFSHWFVPYSNSRLDFKAARRALDFMYGWFIDPIVHGIYPKIMQSVVGNRLPTFTKEQGAMLKGSFDFLGLNYYTAFYAAHAISRQSNSSSTDNTARLSSTRNGVPIGESTGTSNFYVYPKGLYDLLVYTKEKYNSPKIYITENGMSSRNNGTIKKKIEDQRRIDFYSHHLRAVQKAIGRNVNVRGFIAWSFWDVFEWNSGYTVGFGLYYVDRRNGLNRIPKQSAMWFKKSLENK